TQKIVYCFWFFILLFSAYSMCFFLERWGLVQNRLFRLLLPVWYAVNFYVLQGWWIGERTKFSAMVPLPVFLVLLIGLVYNKISVVKAALLAVLVITIFNGGGMRGAPLFGGFAAGIIVTICYFSFFAVVEKNWSIIKRFMFFFLIFIPVTVLLNAYLLLPFLSHTLKSYTDEIMRIGGAENTFGWIDMISKDASVLNLLRFQGIPEWYTSFDHPYGQFFLHQRKLILISFIFPFLLFFSFLLRQTSEKNRVFYLFVTIMIVSLILSMGTHPPTGFLYHFLVQHVPGFAIFRSPLYKFGYAYWLAGGFLMVTSVVWVLDFVVRLCGKRGNLVGVLLTFVFIAGLIVYHFPYLTGDIFRWSSDRLENRVQIPRYVYDTAAFVKTQQISSRILLLPEANGNWSADVFRWKFYSLYPLLADLSRHSFVYNNDSLNENERSLVSALYTAIREKDIDRIRILSRLLNIEYFIVRDDFYSDLSWTPTVSPLDYEEALASLSGITHVVRLGEWSMFKLENFPPVGAIFTTTRVGLLQTDSAEDMPFAQIYLSHQAVTDGLTNNKPQLLVSSADGTKAAIPDEAVSSRITVSGCVNCKVLMQQDPITAADSVILPSSPFYPFIESRRKASPMLSAEQKIHYLLGMSLLRTQELVRMKKQASTPREINKSTDAIAQTITKLDALYMELFTMVRETNARSKTHVANVQKIQDYLSTEKKTLTGDTTLWTGNADFAQDVIVLVHRLDSILRLTEERIKENDVYNRLYFYPPEFDQFDMRALWLQNMIPSLLDLSSTAVSSEHISRRAGNEDAPVIIPYVQSSYPTTVRYEILHPLDLLKNECVGGLIPEVKQQDVVRISLTLSNFSKAAEKSWLVVFPVDNRFLHTGEPTLIKSVFYSVGPDSEHPISEVIRSGAHYKNVFVGMCSHTMHQDYQTRIRDFSIRTIVSPVLVTIHKERTGRALPNPELIVEKINQTKYLISVRENKTPFFLNFQEGYNPDWKLYALSTTKPSENARLGDTMFDRYFFTTWFKNPTDETAHFTGNGYMNTWYIKKMGSYSMILEYRPQQFFYQGLAISVLSFSGILFYLFYTIKRRREMQ
ncbi:MAG: hypothetical protein Q8Q49_03200, partial [bacterium]|nr:hypothetical protein [bacterium]